MVGAWLFLNQPSHLRQPGALHTFALALASTCAGDRHPTQWLKLVGSGAPGVPMVHVTLRRAGGELLRATAQVSNRLQSRFLTGRNECAPKYELSLDYDLCVD
jgi:hypothetical protein